MFKKSKFDHRFPGSVNSDHIHNCTLHLQERANLEQMLPLRPLLWIGNLVQTWSSPWSKLKQNWANYVRSKVASRLGLLSRLRGCLSTEAANKIYLSTVLLILSYCDTCFYPLGSTNRKCLEPLQWRVARIVYSFKPDITTESILENLRWPPLTRSMEKHCVLLVNKCLVGEVPWYFKDYFMLCTQSDNQQRCTRMSITDIILPKFHLDVAKKSFYYHGALALNSLPMNIKTLSPKDRFPAISAFYS